MFKKNNMIFFCFYVVLHENLTILPCFDILIAYKLVSSLTELSKIYKYLVFVFGLVEITFAWQR